MKTKTKLDGQIFGNLQVLKEDLLKTSIAYSYWECQCVCGTVISARYDMLVHRGKICCGCTKRSFKIGDRVGKLVVANFLGSRKLGRALVNYWYCKCDCGTEKEFSNRSLASGRTKSCGCLVREFDRIRYNTIVGEIRPWFYSQIKKQAECRDILFELTPDDLWELWLFQKGICAISGQVINLPKKYREKSQDSNASLDRIDSAKGYIKENIQWIHKDINIMKNKYNLEYFINTCKKIADFKGN